MMLVVDSSVLVAATCDQSQVGTWAMSTMMGDDLCAPHHVLAEATNIVRRLELANLLTRLEATSALQDFLALQIELLPFEPFSDRVWELRGNLTCYDAWYVAIAEALDLPLATLDRRLTRAPGPECRFFTPDMQ